MMVHNGTTKYYGTKGFSLVEGVKHKAYNTPTSNVYQRRTSQTLTPLMVGKIQYHKFLKEHNIDRVIDELKLDNNVDNSQTIQKRQ